MPNLRNAKKALRQSEKRGKKNQVMRDELRSVRRSFRKALDGADIETAKTLSRDLIKRFDKAVQKGVLKPNTAARYKSRMMKKLNALLAK